jgi:hypothetical protein
MQPPHGSGRVRRRAGAAPAGESLVVPRADLEAALEEVTIAYENAVAAADDGVIDFQPFDGLPEAIRILDAALAEEWTS